MKDRKCRVCGFTELERVTTLQNYPMVAGPTTKVSKTMPTCDLEVELCHRCGTCVLLNTDVDSLAYDDDYTSSNITYGQVKSMDERTDCFAKFISRAYKPRRSRVLEIGCYDGAFMGLLEKQYEFDMLGCEPCAVFAEEAKRKGYNVASSAFNANSYDELDMIVARNILEHIPSPKQFIRDITSTLKQDGSLVLEVPTGERFIGNGILGTIVPEHPCYFGERSLGRLLKNSFSIVVTEESGATIRALASFPQHSNDDRDAAVDATRLKGGEQVRRMRYDAVRKAIGGDTVDIFGANTCTLELISAGAVRLEQVDRVYDDDPRRWGKYLVNTDLIVSPRDTLRGWRRRTVLICSYTHRQPIANYITSRNNVAVKLYRGDE